MILSRRALYLLGSLGFLLGLGATVAIASSDHLQDDNALMMATSPLVGWSFIGTGLFAWTRRPDNRTGRLMTAVGFTWLIGTGWATESPLLATIGWLFASIPFVLLLHMLVAFPTGRLRGRFERGLVGMGYFATTVVQVAWLLFSDTSEVDCDGCPRNLLLLRDDDDLAGIIFTAQSVIGLLALGAAVVVFALRYRFTPAEHRAALTPVFLAGVVLIVLVQFSLIANVTGGVDVLEAVADLGGQFALIAIPFAFLVGLLRTRLTRAASVSALIERLGHGSNLRDALADALADPMRPAGRSPTTGRARGPRSSARDRWSARSCTTRWSRRRTRARCGLPPRPRGWPSRTTSCRRSCACASRSCASRGRGWSRPPMPSAGASSATCTTAPSSGWWRWRSTCASRASARVRTPRRCSTSPSRSSRRRPRSCASSRAGSIPPS
jgi:hypothetical protein